MKLRLIYALKLTLFSFFLLFLSSCSSDKSQKPQNLSVDVQVETIVPETIPAVYSFVGFTKSSHEVEIRARVQGYLEKVVFKEGAFVKEGDILYQLDQKPFIAALEDAKGALSKQQAILWNAKKTVERLKPLFEQNAASKKDLDSATADELSATAEIQSAKAKVMQAELDLGYTTIKSPISGLAADTVYKEGALITPGPNSLLTTVSVIDPIWVYFSISENERLKYTTEEAKHQIIFPEDGVFHIEVVLADNTIFPHKGIVNFTSPNIDQKTGTMSIRGTLPNPGNVLVPGQFVRINVLGVIRPNAILVPQRAVLEGKSGLFVYVVIDGKAEIRNIEGGDWYLDNWIVNLGLLKDDVVITDGINKIKQGTSVNIVEKVK